MTEPAFCFNNLLPGDPAPWFAADSTGRPRYVFDSAAGHYVAMCFFGTAGDSAGDAALQMVKANRNLFDDIKICFFGVSIDPADKMTARVRASMPGIRFFWDFDGAVSRAYGALPIEAKPGAGVPMRRFWLVLDPTLRVIQTFPFEADMSGHARMFAFLKALPAIDRFAGTVLQAPILFLPNVFELDLCNRLVGLYDQHGGRETGFMAQKDGKTVFEVDHGHKRRKDYTIEDDSVVKATQARIARRIVPEIAKVHNFVATRIERYIVGCYTEADGGHFQPHRDNTTTGTAHRRFAVSINLNEDFDGGEISFPEYGPRSFRPQPGAAIVFSCSLLHSVSKVTRGRRYAFLPFLYDEAAYNVRMENIRSIEVENLQEKRDSLG